MITLRQLMFLRAVADTLSFSRAAMACSVTQPTLSAGIKELEDRLGVQLIERTKRRVQLTLAGEQVVSRGRQVLIDTAEIEALAKSHSNPFEGDLKLGAIPTIGPYLLPQLMPIIRREFPGLRLFLREEMTESLLDGLNAGRLDLVLIALPFEIGSLQSIELFEDGYHLAVPPDWPLSDAPKALIESEQLMLLERGHCLQRHALAAFPGRLSASEGNFAATSLTTLIAMVAEGIGITLLPDLAVRAGVTGGSAVRLIPLPDACPRRITLAWRPTSARAELFHKLGNLLSTTSSSPQINSLM